MGGYLNYIFMKIRTPLVSVLLLLTPSFVFAATLMTPVITFLNAVQTILMNLIPLGIAVALLAFFWGLIRFLRKSDAKADGKNIMLWGIITLFVMVSVWGIITLAQGALGIDANARVTAPHIPGIR